MDDNNARAATASGNRPAGFCVTRALKNARFLQRVAPTIIPADEPAEGFGSIIPIETLARLSQVPEPAALLADPAHRAALEQVSFPEVTAGLSEPMFNGTVYLAQVTFNAPVPLLVLPAVVNQADMQTARTFLSLSALPISAYAGQYGVNYINISPDILEFQVSVGWEPFLGMNYTDTDLQGWINEIARLNNLSDSDCVVVLNPPGVVNRDCQLSAGYLGYHGYANLPYAFVNVVSGGLTVADTDQFYAVALSHELAETTVDPRTDNGNPEVCDGCGPNCQNVFVDYFDYSGVYIQTVQAAGWPPGVPPFAYSFCINAIVKPTSVNAPCPPGAPATACAYAPPAKCPIVSAVSRSTDHLDIFAASPHAAIETAAWEPDFTSWRGWWQINAGLAAPGGSIFAVSRNTNKLDIFAVGTNYGIYTAAWEPDFTDGWHGWWRLGDLTAAPGTSVHAVSRSPDRLDVFAVRSDFAVCTTGWSPGTGWTPWQQINGVVAAPGTSVFGVSRSTDHLDIFAVGTDHGIYTAAWEPDFTAWRGWWHIQNGYAAPGTSVFGVSRSTDHLDIFAVGTDHGIYTAAWEPDFTTWRGWWHIQNGYAA